MQDHETPEWKQEHKRNNPDELGVGLNCMTGKILFRTRGKDGGEFFVPIVLAAAAPELLEALTDCYAMAIAFAAMYAEQRGLKSGERVWQHAEALSKAQAAIAKAEGR